MTDRPVPAGVPSRVPGRIRGRVRRAAVTAAAALTLAGCGAAHPGAAAVVGSESIPMERVDGFAEALCSANLDAAAARGEPAPELATRGARQGALQVLIEAELSRQFGENLGIEPSARAVSEAVAQNAQGIAMLPADERDDFRSALEAFTEGQLILIEAGRRALAEEGRTDVTDQEALAEGQRLRAEYVERVDIEVDPRFGTFERGLLQPRGGSLSVPVSARATGGSQDSPSADWISSLPATQKCA